MVGPSAAMTDNAIVVQGLAKRFGEVIGLAGQYAAIDPNLTGRENLRLTGRLAQMPTADARTRADELLERFQLSDAGDRPARTYSGGMRRRLDVAAALVQRPPVVFLDEPTTGLDIFSREGLWEMIRELVAEGTTVLLTTQYLEEADRLADRIAVVDGGRVIANDTPFALKSQLGNTVIEMGMADGARAAQAEPRRRLPRPHRPSRGGRHRRSRRSRRRSTRSRWRCPMTTAATTAAPAGVRRRRNTALRPLNDALAITGRNLIAYRRVPQLLVFSTIQPVIFVLLFRYVFGGAVQSIPGVPYVDFLIPGIFVQTTVFGAIATAIGLATDLKSGLLERFRSLPMARSAVLVGRTLADLSRNVFVVALMALVGFGVGFRVHTNTVAFIFGLLLVLAFGYAMSWIFATVGLRSAIPRRPRPRPFP